MAIVDTTMDPSIDSAFKQNIPSLDASATRMTIPEGTAPDHDEKPHPPHSCTARNACHQSESPRRAVLVAINRWSASTRQRSGAATPRDLEVGSNQTPRHMPARIMSRVKARQQDKHGQDFLDLSGELSRLA